MASITSKFVSQESAWSNEKVALERAAEQLTTQYDGLAHQNALLHAQLEKLATSAQRTHDVHAVAIVAALEKARNTESGVQAIAEKPEVARHTENSRVVPNRSRQAGVADAATDEAQSVSALLEVVRYLRREKEVACCQRELKIQEGARLTQQLTVARRTAEDLRLQLQRETERGAKEVASEAEHARLLAGVQENTLLRESNLQLREQERRAADRAETAEASALALKAEYAQLKGACRALEAAKKALEADKMALVVERDRYAKRMNDVVEKYHQVDPAEHNKLKRQLGHARSEVSSALKDLEAARAQLEAAKADALSALRQVASLQKSGKEAKEQLESTEKGVTRFREALKKCRSLLQEKRKRINDLLQR